MTVAKPKKARNPTTSVTVVTKALEPNAGSKLNLSRTSGTKIPANPAIIRFKTIANAKTTPSIGNPYQK